jgi:hypothetical protein
VCLGPRWRPDPRAEVAPPRGTRLHTEDRNAGERPPAGGLEGGPIAAEPRHEWARLWRRVRVRDEGRPQGAASPFRNSSATDLWNRRPPKGKAAPWGRPVAKGSHPPPEPRPFRAGIDGVKSRGSTRDPPPCSRKIAKREASRPVQGASRLTLVACPTGREASSPAKMASRLARRASPTGGDAPAPRPASRAPSLGLCRRISGRQGPIGKLPGWAGKLRRRRGELDRWTGELDRWAGELDRWAGTLACVVWSRISAVLPRGGVPRYFPGARAAPTRPAKIVFPGATERAGAGLCGVGGPTLPAA